MPRDMFILQKNKNSGQCRIWEDFLVRQGEKLLRSGREKRLAGDHSITIRGNRWYDHTGEEKKEGFVN